MINISELNMQEDHIKKAALKIRAVNHKLRRQLLHLLHKKKKLTVTEIYVELNLEQSVASQHLAILRKAGIVCWERKEKFMFYTVNYLGLALVQQKSLELNVTA